MLVEKFAWIMVGFGAFLAYTGGKALFEFWHGDNEDDGALFNFDDSKRSEGKGGSVSSAAAVEALQNNAFLRVLAR